MKDTLLFEHLNMPILQFNLIAPNIHQVELLLIQQVPLIVNMVGAVS
jgi:hypothetical protein